MTLIIGKKLLNQKIVAELEQAIKIAKHAGTAIMTWEAYVLR